jgi:hypothetical protein
VEYSIIITIYLFLEYARGLRIIVLSRKEALSLDISDHCPIILHSNASMIRSKPRFHFEIFWPKFEDYLDTV